MRKSMAILLTAAMSASLLAGCGSSSQSSSSAPAEKTTADSSSSSKENADAAPEEGADASYTIGIGQFAEHGSLDNCREGFIQGLAEAGIEEGTSLTILYSNAQADGGTASQIANTFAGKDVDLMCGIATPMAQAQYSLAMKTDIPVIFTAVTDPVAAELANADGTPVGEITGTSDKLPIEQQLQMIREILPDAKNIGIMYTTSEVNSESAIAEYKELAPKYGFETWDDYPAYYEVGVVKQLVMADDIELSDGAADFEADPVIVKGDRTVCDAMSNEEDAYGWNAGNTTVTIQNGEITRADRIWVP